MSFTKPLPPTITTTQTLIASCNLIGQDVSKEMSKGLGIFCYAVGRHSIQQIQAALVVMREVHVIHGLEEYWFWRRISKLE